MSKIKPILFNTEMVKAILDGRKTVTRRVIRPHYKGNDYGWRIVRNTFSNEIICAEYYDEFEEFTRIMEPPYQPADVLYVRETWAKLSDWTDIDPELGMPDTYLYRAEWEDGAEHPCWHPSIHMPKEAARIWLRVTNVRVERLQDIDFADVINEGIKLSTHVENGGYCSLDHDPLCDFIELWDSAIKKSDLGRYGWKANPYVWTIEFERRERPENEA